MEQSGHWYWEEQRPESILSNMEKNKKERVGEGQILERGNCEMYQRHLRGSVSRGEDIVKGVGDM